jgi:cytochrome P450
VRDEATGEGFGFDELVDQVAMLFLAGHETSASALSWALHLLAHDPQVQERLHEEACRVLPALDTEGANAIKDLTLARDVFRETLRLFPPVGFLARQSAQACPMRDKTIPAGGSVVVSPWLIQRHRDLWARPDEFDPDRYSRDQPSMAEPLDEPAARESLRQAYLPFGMGPRICIGAAFALQEAALILALVARHVRVEPVPGETPEPVGRLTIRAENGIRLKIFPREAG